MTIKVGDRMPSVKLMRWGANGPEAVSTDDLFKGKTVALFGVPGAFTPKCSEAHLPGFVREADAIKGKGVDAIICTAVNDVFVMHAWSKDQHAEGKVDLVADGDAVLTRAAGLEFDLTGKGLGLRCQRFSMLVKDGVVTQLNIDPPGSFGKTSAEEMLKGL
jgi:peroxiredoxin (alkyl hydroperoxide reductase subunit C)